MRRAVAVWGAALAGLVASCATPRLGPLVTSERAPSSAWAAPARRPPPLLVAARSRPELGDLVLYLEAREATRHGLDATTIERTRQLGERFPDSIWLGSAQLLAGRLQRKAGDLDEARRSLEAARDALRPKGARWVTATLALADVASQQGDDANALDLVRTARSAKLRGVALRRARRTTDRIRRQTPALFEPAESRLADAELLLGEGDANTAAIEANMVLDAMPSTSERAQALWVRARAERALGQRGDAEASCLEVAAVSDTLGPKALATAARWRWNADDDTGALRLYRQLIARFPRDGDTAEARYAIGRIHQEAGRYDEAFDSYDRLAREFPRASVAAEARWRAGWVRYLAGDLAAAAAYFERIVDEGPSPVHVAAEYWAARIRGQLQDPRAESALAILLADHPTTYYAGLAAARLGGSTTDPMPNLVAPPPSTFPEELSGPHAARARALADLGFPGLARREVDALEDAPRLSVAQAYTAVGAPGAAIATARALGPDDESARRFLYPLGFWPVVEQESRTRGLDPLLVTSLIRQESLFFPDAVSPADAHGLMQLLPRTARDVAPAAGLTPGEARALHDVPVNVRLGTTLLRRLLDRYDGSAVKALAAYNGGEDAVAKWERRYGPRDDDEFAELISFRETRDYVKLVLGNLQVYRQLYAASPLATNPGNPPKAPFDMTTITSPGALVAIR